MKILLAGASGDAGRAVLQALLNAGHEVTAIYRQLGPQGPGADAPTHLHKGDLLGDPNWHRGIKAPDIVISCLASRTGFPSDARAVEYEANQRLLQFALSTGAKRFVLLSAICVQRPMLAFQFEKLRFEMALRNAAIEHTIIRPTAFFKSLSGQIKRIRAGKPFLMFGDGRLTSCLPISMPDLAAFIAAKAIDHSAANQILPIGGPGAAITPRDQAQLLFKAFDKPLKLRSVTPRLFSVLSTILWPAALVSTHAANRAEFLRIGRYYATQSMLMWDVKTQSYRADMTPQTGTQTLSDFYHQIAKGAENSPELGAHKLF